MLARLQCFKGEYWFKVLIRPCLIWSYSVVLYFIVCYSYTKLIVRALFDREALAVKCITFYKQCQTLLSFFLEITHKPNTFK